MQRIKMRNIKVLSVHLGCTDVVGNGSQEGVFFIWAFFLKKNAQKNAHLGKKRPKKTPKKKTPIFEK